MELNQKDLKTNDLEAFAEIERRPGRPINTK